MNTPNNRRIRETDEKIIRAVYEIMTQEEKPPEKITVREVCDRTGIHRSTFYAHYRDVYDVLEKVERTMSLRLTESFLKRLDEGAGAAECFESLLRFVSENRAFYSLYLNGTNRSGILTLAWELFQERFSSLSYRNLGVSDEEEMNYHGIFFLFGFTAMIRHWLSRGCPETPAELYAILQRQSAVEGNMLKW